MRIHCIRHEPFEGLAAIQDWIQQKGYTVNTTHRYLNQEFPSPDHFDILIIMGGTASVYDDSPLVREEKLYLRQVLAFHKKIIGICLGAQFLADALGARVYPGVEKEIGWFPITYTLESKILFPFLPQSHEVFHWHGDTFDIPVGATPLASSSLTPNQGFIIKGHILALQYHLEMTTESISKMIQGANGELKLKGNYIQSAEEILGNTAHFKSSNHLLHELLDNFCCT